MGSITIDLSNLRQIVNDAYWPYFGCNTRNFVMMGGAGSGKSVFAAQKIAVRLMREFGHHYVAFRKVQRTLKTSVWAEFRKAVYNLGVTDLWHPNLSEMTMTFKPNGNVFRCAGMDDQEKLKSIVGMTGAWMEEATEFLPEDYEQINLRLRGRTKFYKQIIMSFNPISALHWIKRYFFDCPQDGRTTTLHTTYKDNRFLDAEYVKELESLKDRDHSLWEIYTEGLWGIIKGLIYKIWHNRPAPSHVDEIIYGLDFGFNNPSALVRINTKDKAHYLEELIYEPGLTTPNLIEKMREFNIRPWDPIYCDAAEPDRIAELCNAGFNALPGNKGQGSVHAGINFVRGATIYTNENNVNINRENATYKWKEDKEGRLIDDPLKMFDHAMDAIRYALFTHYGLDSGMPKVATL